MLLYVNFTIMLRYSVKLSLSQFARAVLDWSWASMHALLYLNGTEVATL